MLLISNLALEVPAALVLPLKAMAGLVMPLVPSTPTLTVLLAVAPMAVAVVVTMAVVLADQETEDGKTANMFLDLQTQNSNESCSAYPMIPQRPIPVSTLPTTTTFPLRPLAMMFPNPSPPSPILLLMTI